MWKSIENSVKHLSNPYVAITVVAAIPWAVIVFVVWMLFGETG